MIETDMKLDYLTSLFISHHVVSTPTKRGREYNPGLFESAGNTVSQKERKRYRSFVMEKGYGVDEIDRLRFKLFFPQCTTVEECFNVHPAGSLPENVRGDIKRFEGKFKPYWGWVESYVQPVLPKKTLLLQEHIDSFYDVSEEMTGIVIERPGHIDVHVVEGLAPSAFITEIDRKRYIVIGRENVTGKGFAQVMVHEVVPHYVIGTDSAFKDVPYPVEEALVKLMTEKITEGVFGQALFGGPSGGEEARAYAVFERNWENLKPGRFAEWYAAGLEELLGNRFNKAD